MKGHFSQYSKGTQFAIIVGVGCIVFGLWRIAIMGFGNSWWVALQQGASAFFSYAWPIAFVAVGCYLLWAGKTGRLDGALAGRFNPPLGRSMTDKRFAGVCGGLAHFIGIDATIVRVVMVILFFASPWFCLLAYVLAALFMPRV
ncbi:MAG: PspC domain-containing protein [Raoultibacter sp.]